MFLPIMKMPYFSFQLEEFQVKLQISKVFVFFTRLRNVRTRAEASYRSKCNQIELLLSLLPNLICTIFTIIPQACRFYVPSNSKNTLSQLLLGGISSPNTDFEDFCVL